METWSESHGASVDINSDAFFTTCASKVRDVATSITSSSLTMGVLELSLGIRRYSPRLEMFRTLAEAHETSAASGIANAEKKTCCRAHVGDKIADDVDTLKAILTDLHSQNSSNQFDSVPKASGFDHVYPAPAPDAASTPYLVIRGEGTETKTKTKIPVVTLYASLGSDCFFEFHAALKDVSNKGAVRYIHRPVVLHTQCAHQGDGCVALGFGASDGSGADGSSKEAGATSDTRRTNGEGTEGTATPSSPNPTNRLTVSGYGVEMAVKNMEYKAIDDDDTKDASDSTDSADAKPELKLSSIKNLGLQAVRRIVTSKDPLQEMIDVSFDFPEIASELSNIKIDEATKNAVMENFPKLSGGGSLVLSLNGEPLEMDVVNIFSLLDRIADELKMSEVFRGIKGLDVSAVKKLLRMRMPAGGGASGGVNGSPMDSPPRLDIVTFGDSSTVKFTNDVEKDRAFKSWNPSLNGLIEQSQRGGPPQVRRNLLNMIAVVRLGGDDFDAEHRASWAFVDALEQAGEQGVGIRIAHVLLTDQLIDDNSSIEDDSSSDAKRNSDDPDLPSGMSIATALARAHTTLTQRFSGRYAGAFLKEVSASRPVVQSGNPFAPPLRGGAPTWTDCELAFKNAHKKGLKAKAKSEYRKEHGKDAKAPDVEDEMIENDLRVTLKDIFDASDISKASQYVSATKSFLDQRGVLAPAGLVNGLYFTLADANKMGADLTSLAFHFAQRELDTMARAVYAEELSDELLEKDFSETGAYGWVHKDAIKKRSAFLEAKQVEYVVMNPPGDEDVLAYLGEDSEQFKGVTAWVVADASSEKGAALIATVVSFVDSEKDSDVELKQPDVRVAVLDPQSFIVVDTVSTRRMQKFFRVDSVDGLLIVNGRLVPVFDSDKFDADDFAALVSFEASARSEVRDAIGTVDVDATAKTSERKDSKAHSTSSTLKSDQCMHASSLVARRHYIMEISGINPKGQVVDLTFLETPEASFSDSSDESLITLEAVLDPLSPEARRVTPVLKILRDALKPYISVRVILNPKLDLEKLPLTSFYRYASPRFAFPKKSNRKKGKIKDIETAEIALTALNPSAFFASLPVSQTLTTHLDTPEQWLVTIAVAAYDLDNVRLEDLDGTGSDVMFAEYQLEALLVTGHCSEAVIGNTQPRDQYGRPSPPPSPRGTQLVIGQAGTIVMSNLGYFQLPTQPGARVLSIRDGRSSEVYRIKNGGMTDLESAQGSVVKAMLDPDGVEGTDSETDVHTNNSSSADIFVSSWNGRIVGLALEKRQGMEHEDVLEISVQDVKSGGSGVGWLERWFGGSKDTKSNNDVSSLPLETIHVFSVASGHLYERFLKIMMLSVRRQTKNPVKFWFIKNWLSPRFKDFLPHIAKEYGFEYELVTYKWPTWLNRQTEKQRIIWAYKLLFLDVLFPLTLDKIIFVDADQVVRADLDELWQMDLHGAPYAYTPFCDNNKEMEGYRFWKHGFWRTHLNGKPYHISALYVVDLKQFRKTAAGDQLRVIYEQLSQDPNSLANLDQDLPNYAQHQVPIFSLPQNWLWCESWCGDETKAVAKTIDLCNNPMTKEPKLLGAARIVSEWPGLDAEVRRFTSDVEKRLYGGKQLESHQERTAREAAETAKDTLSEETMDHSEL